MNQTDKNIALAKECGAKSNTDTEMYYLLDGTLAFRPEELNEYTSRVCAELASENLELKTLAAKVQIVLWDKDTIIAMQAEALKLADSYLDENEYSKTGKIRKKIAAALSATVETVEAWKNRQGDKK